MKINKYQLARDLNVSHQTVYKWFNGKCMPRSDKLIKLAKLLNLPPEEVMKLFK